MSDQAYYLIEIHEKHQRHVQRRIALERCADRSYFMFKILTVIYCFAVLSVVIYPILFFILFKEKVTFLTLIMPGTNPQSYYGFIINTAYQVYLLAAAVNGLLVYDGYFMILSIHFTAFVDMFKINLLELGQKLEQNQFNKRRTLVLKKLREILVEHQICMNFLDAQNECFALACTVQAWSSTWSIVFSLFIQTRVR